MKKVQEIEELIKQRETIINDLQITNESITGIAIRFNSRSTTFHNVEVCDYSDIVKILLPKISNEIEVLKSKLPQAKINDDIRDEIINKFSTEVDNLINENKFPQALMKLKYLIREYPEFENKLEDLQLTLETMKEK